MERLLLSRNHFLQGVQALAIAREFSQATHYFGYPLPGTAKFVGEY